MCYVEKFKLSCLADRSADPHHPPASFSFFFNCYLPVWGTTSSTKVLATQTCTSTEKYISWSFLCIYFCEILLLRQPKQAISPQWTSTQNLYFLAESYTAMAVCSLHIAGPLSAINLSSILGIHFWICTQLGSLQYYDVTLGQVKAQQKQI